MKIETFLDQYPPYFLVTTIHELLKKTNSDLMRFSLTFIQSMVLVSFYFEEDKKTTPQKLTKSFGMTKSNLSHVLADLEEKKLILRKINLEDKRKFDLTLTKKGEEISLKLISYFDKSQRHFENQLGEKELGKMKKNLGLLF